MLGAFAALCGGCASFSTHLTPKPTDEGKFELNAHFDVLAIREDSGQNNFGPNVEVDLRYGLSEYLDIGAKANVFGAEVNSRVLLVRQPPFHLAIVPGAGFIGGELSSGHAQAMVLSFSLPVLGGIDLSEHTMLIFGTKAYLHQGLASATQTSNKITHTYPGQLVLYPGAVLGFLYQFRDNVALFPEINVLFPYLADDSKLARPVFQGGVAIQFQSGR
jgi:hypothetical protein